MVTIRIKKRKNGSAIYLDCYSNGSREWVNTGLRLSGNKLADKKTLEKVEVMKAKKVLEIDNGSYQHKTQSFTDYVANVINMNPEYKRQANIYINLINYKIDIKFSELGLSFWEGFQGHLRSLSYAESTIMLVLKILKAILNRAVSEGVILRNPLSEVKTKRISTNKIYLELEELLLLYNTPCNPPIIKSAFLFACYTGLRLSDVENLKWTDVNNNQLTIKQQKTRDYVTIPISDQAREFMPEKKTERVFPMPARSVVSNVLRAWVSAAGITKPVTFHSSRHTYATMSLIYNVPIETVSAILGHADIKTTRVYAKIVDAKKRQAVDSLPRLNKK